MEVTEGEIRKKACGSRKDRITRLLALEYIARRLGSVGLGTWIEKYCKGEEACAVQSCIDQVLEAVTRSPMRPISWESESWIDHKERAFHLDDVITIR